MNGYCVAHSSGRGTHLSDVRSSPLNTCVNLMNVVILYYSDRISQQCSHFAVCVCVDQTPHIGVFNHFSLVQQANCYHRFTIAEKDLKFIISNESLTTAVREYTNQQQTMSVTLIKHLLLSVKNVDKKCIWEFETSKENKNKLPVFMS